MYHHRPTYPEPIEVSADTILSLGTEWRYADVPGDLGTAWRESDYDDASWPVGQGLFVVEDPNVALPGPRGTPLPTGRPTHYFRTSFEILGPTDDVKLKFSHVIDDGAVFYLNGEEFARVNMRDGEITYDSLAFRSVGDAKLVGGIEIPTSMLRAGQNVLAVELHQNSINSPDVVFGAQIDAANLVSPAQAYEESSEEWLELFNRSDRPVDLTGWKLADAVKFSFRDGAVLQPGEYAVVTGEASTLSQLEPTIRILGSYAGSLSNDTDRIQLLDEVGNLADEVKYFDGGYWPEFADGGGSSLELMDPHADNNDAAAWRASDETARSEWRHYTYTRVVAPVVLDPPINFQELVMGLLSAGEVWIDNISVIDDPEGAATELMQNGTFEADTAESAAAKWRVMGTHERTQVIADPAEPDNNVMRLIADGRMNYLSNHVESTLANGARSVDGRTYQISFDAKWISGTPQLHTELYYKDAARSTILAQPAQSGTPGRANSTGMTNLGPVVSGLRHEPVVPASDQDVTIYARAADPDGVAALTLVYRVNGRGEPIRVPMLAAASGEYSATIPAQANNTVVQFYVESVDGQNAVAVYPPAGPDSHALYKVRNNFARNAIRHDFQIVMLPDDVNRLHTPVNMVDNNHLGTTVIYDGQEVFYDTGTRLRGSMFSRQNRAGTGYNVRFRPEQLFRGVHDSVAFDQNGEEEALVKFVALQSGNLGGSYNDAFQLVTPSGSGGGATLTYLARHSDIFLREQFENGGDGTLFKFEGIRVLTSTVDGRPESLKLYQPIGWVGNFDIQDLGDDKELYRWPFLINGGRDRDDYSRIIDMAKAFSLTGDALERAVAEVLDMDNWTQTFALMSLFGIGDAYSQGNPHNLNLYVRPSDDKVLALPWDWDFVFSQAATAALHGNANIGKILNLPQYEHLFLGQLDHLMNTVFNRD
ncbi:MAG: lamin tail domain-containing protein, partial [Planctomycetales bacterium]|nr:lamin tail domain-containing protein [Planctomycetales bacterium]